MRKYLARGLGLLAIIGVFILFVLSGWTEFIPLRLDRGTTDRLIAAPELRDPGFDQNLRAVLDFYHQPYRTNKAGVTLVRRYLMLDKELVWNYTNEALRSENGPREGK